MGYNVGPVRSSHCEVHSPKYSPRKARNNPDRIIRRHTQATNAIRYHAAKDLEQFNITIMQELPGISNILRYRLFWRLVTVQKPGSHNRISYIDCLATLKGERQQWIRELFSPLSDSYLPTVTVEERRDFEVARFPDSPSETRMYFEDHTKPLYEGTSVCRIHISLFHSILSLGPSSLLCRVHYLQNAPQKSITSTISPHKPSHRANWLHSHRLLHPFSKTPAPG